MLRLMLMTGLLLLAAESAAQQMVVFEIGPLVSKKGSVRVAVYHNAHEFPENPFCTLVFCKDSLEGAWMICTTTSISPGNYAFSAMDDENESGTMEYNRIGLPAEAFGFANNPRILLRTPAFDKCTVAVTPPETRIKIILRR